MPDNSLQTKKDDTIAAKTASAEATTEPAVAAESAVVAAEPTAATKATEPAAAAEATEPAATTKVIEPASASFVAPSPEKVQEMARRLSNDSKKKGFFTFEASWGHRMLLGLSIALILLAIIFVIYCVMRLIAAISAQDYAILAQFSKFVYFYYGCGIVAGLALLPPAIIGICVAKSGKHTILVCIAPIIAIALALILLGGRLIWGTADIWASIWQAAVMLILPVAYLVAGLKVHTFTKKGAQNT